VTRDPRTTAWRQTVPWRGTTAWHVHLPPLMADGLSIPQAATELDIDAQTVRWHLDIYPYLADRVALAKEQGAMARAVVRAVAAMRRPAS
jgi:hypothetical protein